MKTYKEVAKIRSHSDPEKFYTISKDEEGLLSCNCPSWIYKNNGGKRFCKHLKEYFEQNKLRVITQGYSFKE